MSTIKDMQRMFAQDVLNACVNGICPWQSQVFGRVIAKARSVPKNYAYNGINSLFLALRMLTYGWTHPYFGTAKAWKQLGVKTKDEYKTSSIVYYKWFVKKDKDGHEILDERGRAIQYPIMKYYKVVNVEDTDADLSKYGDTVKSKTVSDNDAMRELMKVYTKFAIKTGVGLDFSDTSKAGSYNKETDTVVMPNHNRYTTTHAFCEDFLHQMALATAAEGRCDRKISKNNGEVVEELIAEMASSIVMSQLGIAHTKVNDTENWKAYCAEWAAKIQADPLIIWRAAGKAVAAAEYILDTKFSDNSSEETDGEEK